MRRLTTTQSHFSSTYGRYETAMEKYWISFSFICSLSQHCHIFLTWIRLRFLLLSLSFDFVDWTNDKNEKKIKIRFDRKDNDKLESQLNNVMNEILIEFLSVLIFWFRSCDFPGQCDIRVNENFFEWIARGELKKANLWFLQAFCYYFFCVIKNSQKCFFWAHEEEGKE